MTRTLQWLLTTAIALFFALTAQAVMITGGFTGNWFNPETSGQGFQIQVLPGGRAGVFWFTFDDEGNQVWALGVGRVKGDTLELDMQIPRGARFGDDFDPADIQQFNFGEVRFEFSDCNSGTVTWESNDPRFGSGSMPIQRLTANAGKKCTGSIADNTTDDDPELDFEIPLENLGVFPEATAIAGFEQTPLRSEFEVELEDLPEGGYALQVDGTERGVIEVTTGDSGTGGEIEFSSPRDEGEELLDFDPLGKLVQIFSADTLLFEGVLEPAAGDDMPDMPMVPPFGMPPIGNNDIEKAFDNTGLDPDASGEMELEQRPNRVDFEVEIKDLDPGVYELWVGGELRGEIEVVQIGMFKTRGRIEFRFPAGRGKLPLDFDPLGQLVTVEQGGAVFLEAVFPAEPENGEEEDDEDEDEEEEEDDDDDDMMMGMG